MQTQPFTYIVGWTKANIYYIGVKYAKGCKPEDLGTTYFTSSKKIGALWAYIEPDFKCIYPFDTADEALAFEETLQQEFNVLKSSQFANKQIRGKHFKMDQDAIERMRKTKTGRAGPNLGRKMSDAHKLKLSVAFKGRYISPEHREKISSALKGKKKAPEHIARNAAAQKGKKGVTWTEEQRKKFTESIKRNPKAKRVYTPDGIFESRKAASKHYNVTPECIGMWIKKKPFEFYYISKGCTD